MRLIRSTVDGVAVTATVSDQTILVPLGGSCRPARPSPSASATGDAAEQRSRGSNWLFTRANGIVDAYRWLPWVSRDSPFNRPNHGDPFVTPVEPAVRVTIDDRPQARLATTGRRVAAAPTA